MVVCAMKNLLCLDAKTHSQPTLTGSLQSGFPGGDPSRPVPGQFRARSARFMALGGALALVCGLSACSTAHSAKAVRASFPADYQGKPFADARYAGGPQRIPGRVKLAYYDLGGEGVAYHDSTPQNLGSGGLNPLDGTYLNEFRHTEGVDTSYTKSFADLNPYDRVKPEMDQLYVGWTDVGEWVNLTVQVAKSGDYSVGLMYTSNGPGVIGLSVNRQDATGPLALINTNSPKEDTAWRQWHHWNKMTGMARVHLAAGKQLLTVRILANGNINLDYLEFTPAK